MAKLSKRSDGRYYKQVYIGQSAENKKVYKNVYGATIKEVEKAAAELKVKIGKGFDPALTDCSFLAYAKQYQSQKAVVGLGSSWLTSIAKHIDYATPFSGLPIDKIKPSMLQNTLNELADWHDGKKPLAHKTLGQIYGSWKNIFLLAIPEALSYNPCDKVVIPTGSGATTRNVISDEQRQWIEDTPHLAQRAAMIATYAGLRRGEISALQWTDIDLSDTVTATIRVNKALSYTTDGKIKLKGTKTGAGDRLVSIPTVLAVFLKAEKIKSKDTLLVVCRQNGTYMSGQAWKSRWDSYMSDLNSKYGHGGKSKFTPGGLKLNIHTFGLQELRHTFCTLLYLSGVDVLTARDQMGHTDIKTTLGIYTHLDKIYKKRSMIKLNKYVSAKSNDTVQIV